MNFIKERKHFLWLLLFIPLMQWFCYCEKTVVPKYIMHSRLDDKIPFIKEFVIFYFVWYFYIAYGLIYTGIKSKKDYYKYIIFLFGSMALCYTLYLIFPNGQDLRPKIVGNDIFSRLIAFIYSVDTPTNVAPSLHVLNSIAVDSALRNCEDFRKKKYGTKISFTLVILISLSTLFIKQHSIIDVLLGALLGVIFYIPLYALPNIKEYKENNKVESFAELLHVIVK
ncbi:MAG TPA: phosphatase [Clostridiaceae bacterium]|jgi:membrane-associated phospholipid phosphatase|nr:phosphatase [Clostridiaceae bacterium]HBF78289.1 phosphatase [Clostridiaceae bacterium]HBG39736.1 phosphatase [Clostridiaceae bacterium]HBN28454.1 phosphatase [Clostridiaceae bacterium]HBX48332.1 phosphatase [Clostridiaceae bacterium]